MKRQSNQLKNAFRKKLATQLPPVETLPRSIPPRVVVEDDRTGMDVETWKRAFEDHLNYIQGVADWYASPHDRYRALAYAVRDRLVHRWIKSVETTLREDKKIVFYLSAEFLMGRQLENNLLNIGCWKRVFQALSELDISLYEIIEVEPEPGLGNGGLGRLAACFLDSLATLNIPAHGYGIRYEFGIFEQCIEDGWQVEHPDKWLQFGNPWEIHRPHQCVEVWFGGHTVHSADDNGRYRVRWIPERRILGSPYDTLVPGFGTNMVNTLRLWSAGSTRDFDFQVFNEGDYIRAVAEKTLSENISKVLYPKDTTPQGKELRLRQQYFFVSCSLQDIIRTHLFTHPDLDTLHERVAIQLNDTHPAIAVAELMRLLVDKYHLEWERAWTITRNTLSYTNHTLLRESLETWPEPLFRRLLPRHVEIINEINRRFLDEVKTRFPGEEDRVSRMSIYKEGGEKSIRMSHLATVGSHAVNGVAGLHTELIKTSLLKDFHDMWPERFSNKTNGVTPRRWMMLANPRLTFLVSEKIGRGWITDLEKLRELEPYAEDPAFRETWQIFKEESKHILAEYIRLRNGIRVDPESLFDIQVKRIHEYKRQLLLALYIIVLYNRIKADPGLDIQPRTFIFGGKAAPGYFTARLIIKLINSVADIVNNDRDVSGRLKVVFLSNFNVSLGERVYPAADLSEQISTAGKEASGTGNMKFALNGALTIGTYDGANIEIREAVGEENFFLFGSTVDEIRALRESGYDPLSYYHQDRELAGVIDLILSGLLSQGDRNLFKPLVDSLLYSDEYMLFADFQSYLDCQSRVDEVYRDQIKWTRMAILNVARMGRFSSDRTVREYCDEIWNVQPIQVELERDTTRD